MRRVTLILACLLLSPAPFAADASAAQRRSTAAPRSRARQTRHRRPAAPRSQKKSVSQRKSAPQKELEPLTKDVLIATLEKGPNERRKMTLDEFVVGIQRRGVSFRITPADERKIRKAGEYLSAGDLEKLLVALGRERNYRPKTDLSGIIQQMRVTDNPDGGIYVFVRLAVTNSGVPSVAQKYRLRVMPAMAQDLVVNGGEPAQMRAPFKADDGKANPPLISPDDSLVSKTGDPVETGETVTGWLRFDLPSIRLPNKPALTSGFLRQPGVWYIVSFEDFANQPYEAVYKMR